MNRQPSIFFFSLALLLVALPSTPTFANGGDDWPQWRGPQTSGSHPSAEPPIEWSETKNVRWKVEVPGRGNSSPVVWGDRIFLTTAVPVAESAPEAASGEAEGARQGGVAADQELEYILIAFDRKTGKIIWQRTCRTAKPFEGTHRDGTWASPSPVTDGEHVIAHFGSQGTYAFTMDGEPVWSEDLGDMNTRRGFGEGSSPALHGDTLVVTWDHEGESSIFALDKATGKVKWKKERDEPTSWSTPNITMVDGKAQVIVAATNKSRGYDLATGETIWELGGLTLNVIPTPIVDSDRVFLTSGFRGNALQAVKLAGAKGDLAESDKILWTYERDTPYVPSPVLHGDTLYLLKSNNGILTAFDINTGEVRFGPERLGEIDNIYSSPVAADGRIYLFGRDGTAMVLKHGPKLEVLAVNQLDDRFDSSAALVGDTIVLRGNKFLYALAEKAETGTTRGSTARD